MVDIADTFSKMEIESEHLGFTDFHMIQPPAFPNEEARSECLNTKPECNFGTNSCDASTSSKHSFLRYSGTRKWLNDCDPLPEFGPKKFQKPVCGIRHGPFNNTVSESSDIEKGPGTGYQLGGESVTFSFYESLGTHGRKQQETNTQTKHAGDCVPYISYLQTTRVRELRTKYFAVEGSVGEDVTMLSPESESLDISSEHICGIFCGASTSTVIVNSCFSCYCTPVINSGLHDTAMGKSLVIRKPETDRYEGKASISKDDTKFSQNTDLDHSISIIKSANTKKKGLKRKNTKEHPANKRIKLDLTEDIPTRSIQVKCPVLPLLLSKPDRHKKDDH